MGLFSRLGVGRGGVGRGRAGSAATGASGTLYGEDPGARAHLEDFVRTCVGVEAYIEPATAVTPLTVLLVATDGEWTRRAAPDAAAVHTLGRALAIAVYDVNLTGYPQRMREWNARHRPDR